jgi:hypothetical protein
MGLLLPAALTPPAPIPCLATRASATPYTGDVRTNAAATCEDTTGCTNIDCSTRSSCTDVASLGTGYTCSCTQGDSGTNVTNIPTTDCADDDGSANVECGTGATCGDVAALGTGYACLCGAGYVEAHVATESTMYICTDIDDRVGGACENAICNDVAAPGMDYTISCGCRELSAPTEDTTPSTELIVNLLED